MSPFKFVRLLGSITTLLIVMPFQVQAESIQTPPKVSAPQSVKQRLVLMPLRLGDEDKNRQSAMETALVQGLQEKYEVFSGDQVSQKAREIFLKESHATIKKDCDETRCMQDIAEAFQAELIAVANVSKETDGYFLALSIQNIFDNKVVFSNSVPCPRCNAYQVVDKLRDIIDPSKNKSVAADESTDWIDAKELNTEEAYQAYVARHPEAKYTAQAGDNIWGFIEKRESRKSADNETVKAYQDFIQSNPKSKFIATAKSRLIEAQKKLAPYKPAGIYAGIQAGQAGKITGVKNAFSSGVVLGYNFTESLSAELGYASLYKAANADVMASSMNPGSTGKFALTSYSLVGQYAFLLSENTKLIGGLGIHNSSYTLESGGISMRTGKSTGALMGLKADYSLGKSFGLRAGIDAYNLGGNLKGLVTNVAAAALFKF